MELPRETIIREIVEDLLDEYIKDLQYHTIEWSVKKVCGTVTEEEYAKLYEEVREALLTRIQYRT